MLIVNLAKFFLLFYYYRKGFNMHDQFNKIIIDLVVDFVMKNKLLAYKPYLSFDNSHKKYIFGHQSYGKSLSECYKDIEKYNIFAPITQFNYYSNNYLIKFDEDINLDIFEIFIKKFLNTEYENLFFSTITKIIPINYCIQNQSWHIAKKFLITKPLKSNGLPEVIHTKSFFSLLTHYINEADFEICFIKFCQLNKSLIKRVETQEYLKNLLSKLNNKDKFQKFLIESNKPLTEFKQNFSSLYINKKVLFSHFSSIVTKKKQPVEKLIDIFKCLDKIKPKNTNFDSLFVVQDDERFEELLIFISFNKAIEYSIEDYYLYLLTYFLENNVSVFDNLEKISNYFFLNNKLPAKKIKTKEKTVKI